MLLPLLPLVFTTCTYEISYTLVITKDFQGGRDIISYRYIGVKMGSNGGSNEVKMNQNMVKTGSKWSQIEYDII